MNKEQPYVFIGRFQPWHNGHQNVAERALSKTNHLIILIGSVDQAEDFKNPFSFNDRKKIIEESLNPIIIQKYLSKGIKKQLNVLPIRDFLYNNNKWLAEVQLALSTVVNHIDDITLTGFNKDVSSNYLNFFPRWKIDLIENKIENLDSKEIRKQFFINDYNKVDYTQYKFHVPDAVNRYLFAFAHKNSSKQYLKLKQEMLFTQNYQEQFKNFPYSEKIPFLTGDAVVVCSGYILLIKREALPGMGLFALPGGFIDAQKDYDQIETALRKLKEETKIDLPMPVIKGSIKNTMDFSNPNRSLRWRIFTKAVYIQLQDKFLPKIKKGTDVEKVFWLPLGQINQYKNMFFEDHYHIIDTIVGL